MSCHYHVFLGPYLEVHNPIRAMPTKVRACANEKCSQHMKVLSDSSAQFCPQCGEKICHVEVLTRGRKEFNMYKEFPKENLMELCFEGMPKKYEDYILFRSNISNVGGKTFCDSTEIIPIDQNIPNTEIEQFAQAFPKEIARIEEVFGKPNVKIKWGAIAYWY